MVGQTDSNGNLLVVCASSTENPGDLPQGDYNDEQDLAGVTDSNGNLLCKTYS